MNLPCRFAIRLPDGKEYTVASLQMKPDGRVIRIDTHAIDGSDPLRSGWYTIEGEELEMAELITYTTASPAAGDKQERRDANLG